MFQNIGVTGIIIIGVIILLLFGGKKIMGAVRGSSKAKKEPTEAPEEPKETAEEEQ